MTSSPELLLIDELDRISPSLLQVVKKAENLIHNINDFLLDSEVAWFVQRAISELTCASVSKRVHVQSLSYENSLIYMKMKPVAARNTSLNKRFCTKTC